jgi:hypothetical protein
MQIIDRSGAKFGDHTQTVGELVQALDDAVDLRITEETSEFVKGWGDSSRLEQSELLEVGRGIVEFMGLGHGPHRDTVLAHSAASQRREAGWSDVRIRRYLELYGFTNHAGRVGVWGHEQFKALTGLLDSAPTIRRSPTSERTSRATVVQVRLCRAGEKATGPDSEWRRVSGYARVEGAQLCRTSRGTNAGRDDAVWMACMPPKEIPTAPAVWSIPRRSQPPQLQPGQTRRR